MRHNVKMFGVLALCLAVMLIFAGCMRIPPILGGGEAENGSLPEQQSEKLPENQPSEPESSKSEAAEPKESLPERTNPEESGAPSDNCVKAQWAEEVFTDLSDYERTILGLDESLPLVCFTSEKTVTDFRVLLLNLESVDESGNISFSTEEVYDSSTLTVNEPLLVRMELMGTIPTNGISYVDENGVTRYFAVEVSGYDGSLLLTEFTPQS